MPYGVVEAYPTMSTQFQFDASKARIGLMICTFDLRSRQAGKPDLQKNRRIGHSVTVPAEISTTFGASCSLQAMGGERNLQSLQAKVR